MQRDLLNHISSQIIGGAIDVHKELGPGLLESVYAECLAKELRNNGLLVEEQVGLPLKFIKVKY
ncbi:GxxExxY protein [Natronoflexus pectinivorans]|uniref:GxxExxY protein n=1 Tax=Natronoflexus pectinivorans TaxID=682526 RepID=UPI001FB83CFB|nr:GxxExxY protein [Natronoflexus pectinivorans]